MKIQLVFFLSILFIWSCSSNSNSEEQKEVSQAQEIINNAISFHGMVNLDDADFQLTFREMDYTYSLHDGLYEYTRLQIDSIGREVYDVLKNEGLVRYVNGDSVELKEEKRAAYSRSVNSVIYFFRLPFGLNDPAVIKTYQGTTTIHDKNYHEVKVTFKKAGGGEDFDDVFLYWFDTEDYSMDYLAYLYHTDGGGLRFREAINSRRVNGVLIQDYINYKPEDESIDINSIDELYLQGELEELSKIINEGVQIQLGK